MNEQFLRRVRQIRAANPFQPTRMIDAVRQARWELTEPKDYPFLADLGYMSSVSGTVRGVVDVIVKVVDDQDSRLGDDDVTGTFGDQYQPGAIRNTTSAEYGRLKWYYPSSTRLTEGGMPCARGMSKGRQEEYYWWALREDMRQDAALRYVGVVVELRVDGELIADASLWGIGVTDDEQDSGVYLRDMAGEQIDEALSIAENAAGEMIVRLRRRADALAKAFGVPVT